MRITRLIRLFISIAAALTIGITGSVNADSSRLRLASYLPSDHFATKLVIEPFIEKVSKYTDGAVEIQNFPGGQLATASGTLNAIKSGIANMGVVGVGFVGDTMPLSTVAEIPAVFSDQKKGQAAYWHLVEEILYEAEFQPNKVYPIMVHVTPQMQIALKGNREIKSLADLAGLKIRVPHATAGDAISALGMVPVEMPITDLYLALKRGTVDGSVNSTASILSYKINEVTDTVTTNLSLGSIGFFVFISERDWLKLAPEQQKQLARAGAEASKNSLDISLEAEWEAYNTLSGSGIELITVSDKVLNEVDAALASVEDNWIETVSARNPLAAEVMSTFKEALADQ